MVEHHPGPAAIVCATIGNVPVRSLRMAQDHVLPRWIMVVQVASTVLQTLHQCETFTKDGDLL